MKTRQRLEMLQAKMRAESGVVRRGRGRPRLSIAPERVFELALLGLNNKEIAAGLPCDPKTLARFRPELERARARSQVVVKVAQFRAALAGEQRPLLRALAAADLRASTARNGDKKQRCG